MTSSVEDTFMQALEIKDRQARAAFLNDLRQAELRETVLAMLAAHEQADAFLGACFPALVWPSEVSASDLAPTPEDFDLGSRIGPYQLLRCLGQGGSGLVFEAQQKEPIQRHVALKLLRRELRSADDIIRLETERQTLARMEHPNIARIIDGGTTESGRPYLVMDLVRGEPITSFCEQEALPRAERLRLIIQVASAIQHAHQKGVIHRDLKPSNLLVSREDGNPVVKVIDFGIACLRTPGPRAHKGENPELLGTPAYMSPEQEVGREQGDIRTDIFSLGLVLGELLLGRGNTREPLNRLPEDLHWVLKKATAPGLEERYQSMRAFAQDLENVLTCRPVEAHPDSRLYRTKRLIQRNRLATAALFAAFGSLVLALTLSTWLLIRARAAERHETQLRHEAEERAHLSQAAIFLIQGRKQAANEEVEKMAGVLLRPSVEATRVYHELAVWSALQGDWKTAGARLLALSRVSPFEETDESDNVTRDLVPIAPTLIEAGKLGDYRDFHLRLLNRLGHTHNPTAAEQILKGCLLLPGATNREANLTQLANVVEESLGPRPATLDQLMAWRCAVLGLWYYRIGYPEPALRWSERSMNYENDEQARQAYSLLVHSMALRSLGRQEEATREKDQAEAWINEHFSKPRDSNDRGFWHDWLSAKILLREAGRTDLTPQATPP